MTEMFGELDHPARLLMGPGPINVHPRVLRALSVQLLGQFDPEFTTYMNQTMALYRQVFETANRWTFLIDGTSRAAIEAALVSVLAPGEDVVILNAGRFGLLLSVVEMRFHTPSETGISRLSSLSLNNDSKSSSSINWYAIVVEQIIISSIGLSP